MARKFAKDDNVQVQNKNLRTIDSRKILIKTPVFSFPKFFKLYSVLAVILLVAEAASADTRKIDFDGVFTPNDKLSHGIRIPGMVSPESLAEDGNRNLYSGFEDGRVVRIAPSTDGIIGQGEITNLTSGILDIFPNLANTEITGLPLGVRIFGDDLYVADSVYGLYSVNIFTKEVTSLVSPDLVDPPLGFPNDLYVSKDGKLVYFSDMFLLPSNGAISRDGLCSGRVLEYSVDTKQVSVVLSDLCYANGVQMSDDENLLFVSEYLRYRVRIVDAATWITKKIIDLPMRPDNIRSTGKGTYFVAGSQMNSEQEEKLVASPQNLKLKFSQKLNRETSKHHNIVAEMTGTGEILQSLQDLEGEAPLSQAVVLSDGRIGLGFYAGSILFITDI